MRQQIQALSIHHKLILLMVTISSIVIGVFSFLIYQNQIEVLKASAVENAHMKASLISDSIKPSIIFVDTFSADKTLALLESDSAIESIHVVLNDKMIFSEFYKDKYEQRMISFEEVDLSILESINGGLLTVVRQIKDRGKLLGYLYIRSNLENMNQQRFRFIKILLTIVVVNLLLVFLLSLYFKKIITDPIDKMVEYVEKLSKTRDYSQRMDLHFQDEIGTLVKGFDHLLDAVQEREMELNEHSDNLQVIVDRRTEQLYQKAHFDSLTGLPNRGLLLDRLNHAIATANRRKTHLAVMFLDLDRFKNINDSLGHDIGDQLLKKTASLLSGICRASDTIARIGGDEFVFLLEGIHQASDAELVANKINKAFDMPLQVSKHQLYITTSVGICIYPEDGDCAASLLKNADVSMYCSKQKGLGNHSFYNKKMNATSLERHEIENHLRMAVKNNELSLVYQPQILLKTNRIDGVEALLRWKNAELGNISPAVFISIAEEIGIINQLGHWVISEAVRQVAKWQADGLDELVVAVNISSSQFLGADLVSFVKDEVERYNIAFSRLEFEITEDVFLEHSERTIATLQELQSLGIRIAIDDFGTGYSSLRYLKNLPVDRLKLDGMFVRDLEHNKASQGIVSSTIILAHSLNMDLVAECVETKQQLEFLVEQKCDYVQGYYLYKPQTPEQIMNIFKEKT